MGAEGKAVEFWACLCVWKFSAGMGLVEITYEICMRLLGMWVLVNVLCDPTNSLLMWFVWGSFMWFLTLRVWASVASVRMFLCDLVIV